MSLTSTAGSAMDGLRARVPGWRGRLLRPVTRYREMQFPSFDARLHDDIAASDDYYRYATMGLALARLDVEEIPGAIAEVGVWRGETSHFLHRAAPHRKLFLFDTFTGFPAQDLPAGGQDARFRDTSAAAVAARLGQPTNLVITPGYVPDTLAVATEERFAFVLLDLDLYAPTLASLDFFYDRLNPGGYLVMHDYNNAESDWACKRAFDAFLADRPERVIELGDVWGSALIRRDG